MKIEEVTLPMTDLINEGSMINKIATAAVLGLLGWNVFTTQNLAVEVAVLAAQLETTRETFSAGVADRYTKSEAISDRALVTQRVERIEGEMIKLEGRVRELEDNR